MFLPVFSLLAQNVVSSGGETQNVPGYEVSWTIGEPVIETISSGTNTLTQGFHQSKLLVTPVSELLLPEITIRVFPNPTSDFVTVQFNKIMENSLLSLFDLSGKKLENRQIASTLTQVDLKRYPNGSYILNLTQKNNQLIQSFKIVKQ